MHVNKLAIGCMGIVLIAAACTRVSPPTRQMQSASTNKTTEIGKDSDGGTETRESEAKEKAEYEKTHPGEQPDNVDTGSYKDYSPEAVAAAQQAGKKVILFFHAKWCPDCRALDAAFRAHPGDIPAGATLLKVDYDTQTALKEKFGVVSQHTFVQIDSSGNMVTKWNTVYPESMAQYIK